MNPKLLQRYIIIAVILSLFPNAIGQLSLSTVDGSNLNTINTAVPFLTLVPDARSAGMGDVGAASQPDVHSQHWNAARYAFIEKRVGISLSFRPLLRKIIPDINLYYLSAYCKIDRRSTLSASVRYFSLGSIPNPGLSGASWGTYEPFEMAMDAAYSRKISDHFSMAAVARYIHSDLTGGQLISGEQSKPGRSVAADLGFYYENSFNKSSSACSYALGLNLTNLGTPISYTADAVKVPIPSNIRLGGRISRPIKEAHSLSVLIDANKLMVPTPPIMMEDFIGNSYVLYGKASPETIIGGMIQSFYDAPGFLLNNGSRSPLLEELNEIMISTGLEYTHNDVFSIRTGCFYEHESKGGRQYTTFGLAYKWKHLCLDLAYLLPIKGKESPLANSFSFTLSFVI